MPTARRSIAPRPVGGPPPPTGNGLVYSVYGASGGGLYRNLILEGTNVYCVGRNEDGKQFVVDKFDDQLNPVWRMAWRGNTSGGTSNDGKVIIARPDQVFAFGNANSSGVIRAGGYLFNGSGLPLSRQGLSLGFSIFFEDCVAPANFHCVGFSSSGGNIYPFYARYDAVFTNLEYIRRITSANPGYARSVAQISATEIVFGVQHNSNGSARLVRWNLLTDSIINSVQITASGNSQTIFPFGLEVYDGNIYVSLYDTATRNGAHAATIVKYDSSLNLLASRTFYGSNNAHFRNLAVDSSGVYGCGMVGNHTGGSTEAGWIVKLNHNLEKQADVAFMHSGGASVFAVKLSDDVVYGCGWVNVDGTRRSLLLTVDKNLNLSSVSNTCNTDISVATAVLSTDSPSTLSFSSTTESSVEFDPTEIDPGFVAQTLSYTVNGPCEWNP